MSISLPVLSVVIPVFNESGNLEELYGRLVPVLNDQGDFEIILVDDGSTDNSLEIMRRLHAQDSRVKYVTFSRNFGHEAASSAGVEAATGQAVILMDADLQDPPETIREFVLHWRAGNDVVYAKRRSREGESWVKRFTSYFFYRLLNLLCRIKLPEDTGDFRLMDRKVVDALKVCRERNRFFRGLVGWIGFKQVAVLYDRPPRHSGKTKYNLTKLLLLSLEAITSFSVFPLRLATWTGFISISVSIVLALIVIFQKLFIGIPIPGYPFLIVVILFLGGVQLMLLGVVGEYLGKVYTEVQNRPLYVIREKSE
jgi:glycosyltransferase involved in cell wall biosynthesis